MPLAQRISALMEKIMGTAEMGHLTRDEYESLLKQSGKEAIPFLTAAIRNKTGDTWIACKLLAEINEPVEEAITALTETLDDCGADDSERGWAASALARLGHTDILAARIEQIPEDIIARGLAAPYTAFRDQGRYLPLDYQPLEQILKQFPHIADAVAKNLTPGCSYCEIKPEEASAAQAGLQSSWAFIRYHAENVLEDLQDNL
ncbi:hypothetical protein CHU32_06465 [Superficieibacter electus]|uniref:HEAT repeat domain-containing protein n=2 Tax=Superficieibacter electus TaxID=2022662 RepID=A0A2P5GTJ2_9ENTR|nr:hypothetical protein CHU32_06465 [Superficieibacter electus]